MTKKRTTKTIVVNGEKFEMELRVCANRGCNSEFWALKTSKHSICTTKCWELTNHRPFHKQPMPKIRRPGEKHLKAEINEEMTKNATRAAHYKGWNAGKPKSPEYCKNISKMTIPNKATSERHSPQSA